ncbi:hypothetical protein AB4Z21_25200 [Paenibacillus sp. MCAF20]
MRKQRKWLIMAAFLLVVSIFPHFGAAEGDIRVLAEQDAGDTEASAGSDESAAAEEQPAEEPVEEETPADTASDTPVEGEDTGEVKLYPVSAVKEIASTSASSRCRSGMPRRRPTKDRCSCRTAPARL